MENLPPVWIIRAGKNGEVWEDWVQDNFISIGWKELGDLTGKGKDEINSILIQHSTSTNPYNDKNSLNYFLNEMTEGDIVVAVRGRFEVLGAGRLINSHSHFYPNQGLHRDAYRQRTVEWFKTELTTITHGLPNKTVTPIERIQAAHDDVLEYLGEYFDLKATPDQSEITTPTYEIEKRIARLTWNDRGWIEPTGSDGKSKNPDSYEGRYGYGHEEWLFDTSKLINGFHYGFLEPIHKSREAFQGRTYEVWLYTIQKTTKKRYWVGV